MIVEAALIRGGLLPFECVSIGIGRPRNLSAAQSSIAVSAYRPSLDWISTPTLVQWVADQCADFDVSIIHVASQSNDDRCKSGRVLSASSGGAPFGPQKLPAPKN
jgi:hypothetical protein